MRANVFHVSGTTEDALLDASLLHMQSDLFEWYASEHAAGRRHSRVQRLPAGLFGTHNSPAFGFHGAETNGMLLYFGTLLDKYGHLLPEPDRLRRLWSTAVELYKLIRDNPIEFSTTNSQYILLA